MSDQDYELGTGSPDEPSPSPPDPEKKAGLLFPALLALGLRAAGASAAWRRGEL